MLNIWRIKKPRYGFTIAELIIVIGVIGILAAITIVGYSSWRSTTATNEVRSDLTAAGAAMETARNFGNGYPLSIPSTFTSSPNVQLTYASSSTATNYCISARSVAVTSIVYYLDSSTRQSPQPGACP